LPSGATAGRPCADEARWTQRAVRSGARSCGPGASESGWEAERSPPTTIAVAPRGREPDAPAERERNDVDDIAAAREELAAANVELIGELVWANELFDNPNMAGFGWFFFRGPDGNV